MKPIIYTTDDCHWCHALTEWLDSMGVEYETVDASEMEDIDVVPETHIGDKVFVGFERKKILKALKEQGIVE